MTISKKLIVDTTRTMSIQMADGIPPMRFLSPYANSLIQWLNSKCGTSDSWRKSPLSVFQPGCFGKTEQ